MVYSIPQGSADGPYSTRSLTISTTARLEYDKHDLQNTCRYRLHSSASPGNNACSGWFSHRWISFRADRRCAETPFPGKVRPSLFMVGPGVVCTPELIDKLFYNVAAAATRARRHGFDRKDGCHGNFVGRYAERSPAGRQRLAGRPSR